ncbi:MAG: hypothetical protein BWX48_01581 [Verrucomicrobia bacterium ADurb.Bin006]|jgi:hypothetical protein|nr:MAG: hypothetical protein BWX48_01581 [Verrucomicrobia bacterium ADurb.Bin006]
MAQSPSLTERGTAFAVCSGHGGVSCLGALRIGPGIGSRMLLITKEIGSRLRPLADLPASGSSRARGRRPRHMASDIQVADVRPLHRTTRIEIDCRTTRPRPVHPFPSRQTSITQRNA